MTIEEMREYMRRDAEYRAMGGIGHLIWGGAETEEEKAAREADEAKAAEARVAEEKAEADRKAAEEEAARKAADDDEESKLPDAVRNTLKAQREAEKAAKAAARKAEAEAETLRAKLQTIEDAEKDEVTRATEAASRAEARAEAAEGAARETALRYEVTIQAGRLNVRDPELAARLLDASAVTYGEDGRPTNVEALIKALVDEYPYLKRAQAEEGTGSVPGSRDGSLTEEEIRKRAGGRLPRTVI